MQIISSRGRAIKAHSENKRRLEEKFQIAQLPLTADEQEKIRRVFDNIRRQLDDLSTLDF